MSWVHRGVLAILLRQTGFLTKFGNERWPDEEYEYGQADLDKIIKHFVWRPSKDANPIPLFRLGEDGLVYLTVSRFVQIMLPRGFGKTTTVNAANLIKICYKLRKFLVYLSETADHAAEQLGNIKRELETNSRIIAVFGQMKPERSDGEKWREDYIQTLTGVVVQARGRGGQIRGKNVGGARPDDITFDDVEDKESVSTPEQRRKTLVWLMGDVLPALPQIGETGTITGLGTLLHAEAMMVKLADDPEWITVRFGALDPDGDPIWAYYKAKKQLEALKLAYTRKGLLNLYYLEYESKISGGDNAKFPSTFTYQIMQRTEFVAVALCMDPAISDDLDKDPDYCMFGVTGMTTKGQHHVMHCDGAQGMHPRAQIDEYFRLHAKFDPTHHGIEAVAFQKALVHLMREEMFRRGKTLGNRAYFEITPILHGKTGKIPRVEGALSPRYKAGYVTHQQSFPLYESQLIDWPNGKRDGPDVIAQCITLLDPFAALAFGTDMTEEELAKGDPLARDQYEPLNTDWRRACP